jgi:hypothetical protein
VVVGGFPGSEKGANDNLSPGRNGQIALKAINYEKIKEITQGPDESYLAFITDKRRQYLVHLPHP